MKRTMLRHKTLTWISAGSVSCMPCLLTVLPGHPEAPNGWQGVVWQPQHNNWRVRRWLCGQEVRDLWLPAKRGWQHERPMVLSGYGKRLLAEWDEQYGPVAP